MELVFGERAGGPPSDAAAWTAGAPWMPADAASPIVRYKDPTQMGKVYLLPAGVERPVPGRGPGEMGPDALDPALTTVRLDAELLGATAFELLERRMAGRRTRKRVVLPAELLVRESTTPPA